MLDRQTEADIAAVLMTFAEFPLGTDVAESIIYLALDMDIDRTATAIALMNAAELIDEPVSHRIAATAKGHALGVRMNKKMATAANKAKDEK